MGGRVQERGGESQQKTVGLPAPQACTHPTTTPASLSGGPHVHMWCAVRAVRVGECDQLHRAGCVRVRQCFRQCVCSWQVRVLWVHPVALHQPAPPLPLPHTHVPFSFSSISHHRFRVYSQPSQVNSSYIDAPFSPLRSPAWCTWFTFSPLRSPAWCTTTLPCLVHHCASLPGAPLRFPAWCTTALACLVHHYAPLPGAPHIHPSPPHHQPASRPTTTCKHTHTRTPVNLPPTHPHAHT